jgi:hypothetical protein
MFGPGLPFETFKPCEIKGLVPGRTWETSRRPRYQAEFRDQAGAPGSRIDLPGKKKTLAHLADDQGPREIYVITAGGTSRPSP